MLLSLLVIGMVPLLAGMKQDKVPPQELNALSPRELVILYSKTRMDLAQVEFDWARERSENGQLVMSKAKLERRQSELAVTKEQFNQAVTASSGGLEKVRLCHAEEKVRLAKLDFEAAKKLRANNTLSEYGLERLRLKYELAQLDLALRKNPDNYVTLIEAMQAQIDRQGQEMLALDLRLAALENVSR
jgi:hypothetical protein